MVRVSFTPFFLQLVLSSPHTTCSRVELTRGLAAVCQALRILSFTVTQLPGPNYHCRAGTTTAVREWPTHWWEHITLDLGRQARPCAGLVSVWLWQQASAAKDVVPVQPCSDGATFRAQSAICLGSRLGLSPRCAIMLDLGRHVGLVF